MLRVKETFKGDKFLLGRKEILSFLEKHSFVFRDVLNEHVEATKETVARVEAGLEQTLQEIFDAPRLAWQIYFAPRPKEFRRDYNLLPKHSMIYGALTYAIRRTLRAVGRNLRRKRRPVIETREGEGRVNGSG